MGSRARPSNPSLHHIGRPRIWLRSFGFRSLTAGAEHTVSSVREPENLGRP